MSAKWTGHAVWLVGFRPFFPLACIAGATLPLWWILLLRGVISPSTLLIPLSQWHAHEMFFGFGMAVLGGFLLTATKNWVKVRGYHGHALQILVTAWLLERAAVTWGGTWPPLIAQGASHFFLVVLVALLLSTLLRYRAQDSYRDNFVFVVALPVLVIAKALLLSGSHFAAGMEMTLALFRLAFVMMLERTLVPFMNGAFQVELPRRVWLDGSIKALAVALVTSAVMPARLHGIAAVLLAALFFGRLLTWSPLVALKKLEVGVMYLGGAMLCVHLTIEGLTALFGWVWPFAVGAHVFTFGTMGLIIPAMMLRVAKGHTGRPVVFDWADKVPLWFMLVALGARVVGPLIWPAQYAEWLWLAAGGWASCFGWVAVRITPLVWRPRIDGKEH